MITSGIDAVPLPSRITSAYLPGIPASGPRTRQLSPSWPCPGSEQRGRLALPVRPRARRRCRREAQPDVRAREREAARELPDVASRRTSASGRARRVGAPGPSPGRSPRSSARAERQPEGAGRRGGRRRLQGQGRARDEVRDARRQRHDDLVLGRAPDARAWPPPDRSPPAMSNRIVTDAEPPASTSGKDVPRTGSATVPPEVRSDRGRERGRVRARVLDAQVRRDGPPRRPEDRRDPVDVDDEPAYQAVVAERVCRASRASATGRRVGGRRWRWPDVGSRSPHRGRPSSRTAIRTAGPRPPAVTRRANRRGRRRTLAGRTPAGRSGPSPTPTNRTGTPS